MLKPIAVLAAFLAVANGRNLQPALRLVVASMRAKLPTVHWQSKALMPA